MVNIFDDDADEVGSEIDAYCPKCKSDTTHVIISKYEDEIRRVQCNPCGDVHAFRKPRGEVDDEPPEPISAKKRAAKVKPTWEQVMAKAKKQPRLYLLAEQYHDNELVSHPKFGVGFVSEVIGTDKIEVTFKEEKRVLIHNRKGMSLPPAAYAHAVDTTLPEVAGDKRKGHSKQAAKAAPTDGAAAHPAKAAAKEKGKAAPAPAAKSDGVKGKPPQRKPEPKPEPKPEAKKDQKKVEKKAVVVAKEKDKAKAVQVPAKAKPPEIKPAAKAKPQAAPVAKAPPRPQPKGKPTAKAAKSARPAGKAKPGGHPTAKGGKTKAARPLTHHASKARPKDAKAAKATRSAAKRR
jgi:hypothetical protein